MISNNYNPRDTVASLPSSTKNLNLSAGYTIQGQNQAPKNWLESTQEVILEYPSPKSILKNQNKNAPGQSSLSASELKLNDNFESKANEQQQEKEEKAIMEKLSNQINALKEEFEKQ